MLRFAPSPTGDMHIGNLRVAIYNFLISKKLGQTLILRIEDTDIERNIKSKGEEIVEILKSFNIIFDDIIKQSDNFPLHRDKALKLLKEQKAFYCYCSKEFLDEKRQEARDKKIPFRYKDEWANLQKGNKTSSNIIRFKTTQSVEFRDLIKGEIYFDKSSLDSFVIMRDEMPLYNFACAIDDKDMELIIRGEDHVSNTPKQILIKKALGFKECQYAHLPIILNDQHKKMSKRDNHSSVKYLLDLGLEFESIRNYLIILGNAKLQEVLEENGNINNIIDKFDIRSVSRNPAQFDYKKLIHINKDILRNKGINSNLVEFIKPSFNGFSPNDFLGLINIYLKESNTKNGLKEDLEGVFLPLSKKEIIAKEYINEFNILKKILLDSKDLFNLEYEDFKNSLMKTSNLKGKNFFKPLRILISGKEDGIEIETLYNILSKQLNKILI